MGLLPEEAASVSELPAVEVDLNDPRVLREAMVYHEIFSPPKALRGQREMWDL